MKNRNVNTDKWLLNELGIWVDVDGNSSRKLEHMSKEITFPWAHHLQLQGNGRAIGIVTIQEEFSAIKGIANQENKIKKPKKTSTPVLLNNIAWIKKKKNCENSRRIGQQLTFVDYVVIEIRLIDTYQIGG